MTSVDEVWYTRLFRTLENRFYLMKWGKIMYRMNVLTTIDRPVCVCVRSADFISNDPGEL